VGKDRGKRLWGIRGAIQVSHNSQKAILEATERLLKEIIERNGLQREDVVSAFFTLTPDLNAAFPAEAARKLGWEEVALLCASEIQVPGSLPKVVRVLIHAYLEHKPVHVYLGQAAQLRPDLS